MTERPLSFASVAVRLRYLADQLESIEQDLRDATKMHVESIPAQRPARLQRDHRLVIDRNGVRVYWRGEPIHKVTPKELSIIELLSAYPDRVRERSELLDFGWGSNLDVDARVVDTIIKRIRQKFRRVDPDFDAIETLYGFGYVWRLGD